MAGPPVDFGVAPGAAIRQIDLMSRIPTALLLLGLATASSVATWAGPVSFDPVQVDAGASGDDKAVADLDGDGFADGILGGSQLRWWRSKGSSRQLEGPYLLADANVEFTTDMDVADLDGDGDVDLVVADGNGTGNVEWFENPSLATPSGKGSDPKVGSNWTAHPIGSHGTWAHDIEVGDVDGDGRLDVVTCGNGAFKIFFRNASGSWTTKDFAAFVDDGATARADIDGDGDSDLFVRGGWLEAPANDRRDPAAWSYHAITGSNPGDGPAAVALDVDLDGRIDLLTAPQHAAGSFSWFKNPSTPTVANWPRTEVSASVGSHQLRAADFDGDGRLDVMTGLELAALTVWRISGAPPSFVPHSVASSGGHNAAAGDFDGDCLPDIWAADYIGNPPLSIHWNTSGGIFCDGFERGDATRWTASP